MITAKKLIEMLKKVPENAKISAYEGEDCGLSIEISENEYEWIRARPTDEEDKATFSK